MTVGEDFEGPREDVMPANERSFKVKGVMDDMDRSITFLRTDFGDWRVKIWRDVRSTGDTLTLDREALIQLRNHIDQHLSL